eukprot:6468148-Prymnesium_polylepis.1
MTISGRNDPSSHRAPSASARGDRDIPVHGWCRWRGLALSTRDAAAGRRHGRRAAHTAHAAKTTARPVAVPGPGSNGGVAAAAVNAHVHRCSWDVVCA